MYSSLIWSSTEYASPVKSKKGFPHNITKIEILSARRNTSCENYTLEFLKTRTLVLLDFQ